MSFCWKLFYRSTAQSPAATQFLKIEAAVLVVSGQVVQDVPHTGLAERTRGSDVAPLKEADETEAVEAGVRHGHRFEGAEADGTNISVGSHGQRLHLRRECQQAARFTAIWSCRKQKKTK